MWYTIYTIKTQTKHTCFQCNSPLVLITQTTEKIEGGRFPQTTTTYRCTNEECQNEQDKQLEKRLKLKKDKEAADALRAINNVRNKKVSIQLGKKTGYSAS